MRSPAENRERDATAADRREAEREADSRVSAAGEGKRPAPGRSTTRGSRDDRGPGTSTVLGRANAPGCQDGLGVVDDGESASDRDRASLLRRYIHLLLRERGQRQRSRDQSRRIVAFSQPAAGRHDEGELRGTVEVRH